MIRYTHSKNKEILIKIIKPSSTVISYSFTILSEMKDRNSYVKLNIGYNLGQILHMSMWATPSLGYDRMH